MRTVYEVSYMYILQYDLIVRETCSENLIRPLIFLKICLDKKNKGLNIVKLQNFKSAIG